MYSLDFETMKQVMQEHQMTGMLSAEVSSSIAGIPGPCRIEIKIQAGNIVSTLVAGTGGRHLTGQEAITALARLGRLRWTFTPQQKITTPLPPVIMPVENVALPRKTVFLEQWQMQSWPRIHRVVFAMADGTKSAAKIATLLTTPPDIVERVLRDLQSIGVIVMDSPQRKNYS